MGATDPASRGPRKDPDLVRLEGEASDATRSFADRAQQASLITPPPPVRRRRVPRSSGVVRRLAVARSSSPDIWGTIVSRYGGYPAAATARATRPRPDCSGPSRARCSPPGTTPTGKEPYTSSETARTLRGDATRPYQAN